MPRKTKAWKRCPCGKALKPGQSYNTDFNGKAMERELCQQCYEDYVRRAVRGSANHYNEYREDEDRRHG